MVQLLNWMLNEICDVCEVFVSLLHYPWLWWYYSKFSLSLLMKLVTWCTQWKCPCHGDSLVRCTKCNYRHNFFFLKCFVAICCQDCHVRVEATGWSSCQNKVLYRLTILLSYLHCSIQWTTVPGVRFAFFEHDTGPQPTIHQLLPHQWYTKQVTRVCVLLFM